jgi:2-C-methyl-D-erythritol 4-phosphate cytidylyltransferase
MTEKSGAVGAIIVAAGKGSRMGLGYNKVLTLVSGKPVIEWTIQSFINSKLIENLVLVISPEDEEAMKKICLPYINEVNLAIVNGGADRQDSVYNGLKALPESVELVLIHDGARPFIDKEIIERSIENARKYGAACCGMPVKDTIKVIDEQKTIISTPNRNFLWSAQTPQAFHYDIIFQSYKYACEKDIKFTDDAGIAEAAGYKVFMFEGSYRNIKLTSAEDLLFAELLVKDFK